MERQKPALSKLCLTNEESVCGDVSELQVERFGYTHEEVARKIGKARSSVTETLSLASLPSEVRELCRRADIHSKSLLLQIARQPDEEAMMAFVRRVIEQGMTRDDARRARDVKQARQQPYVFRHQPETREFTLELKFRRSSVSRDEVIGALERLQQLQSDFAHMNRVNVMGELAASLSHEIT